MIDDAVIEFERSRKRNPELSLVPLIDVMLVLMIFFMVAGRMEQLEVLPVDPPLAESSEDMNQGALVIVLGSHDEVLVDDELIDMGHIGEKVKAYIENNPKRLITVKADARMKADKLIDALDTINDAGGKNLTIATQTP